MTLATSFPWHQGLISLKAWLQLGKFGDIISLLPILNSEFISTGRAPKLIVSKHYRSVFDYIDYVDPVVYDGHWQDLEGALKFAKRNFQKVICPQHFGIPFSHRHPSFQYDQWDRAGYLDQWDKLPLEIPRLNEHSFKKKTILVSDHSQSSPFFRKEDMVKLLSKSFPDMDVVRIAGKVYPSLFDVLPIMDAASVVVCVDSSHLHISKASKSPVVAFTANLPQMWHGSAYSSRFAFHCRYSDFDARKDELVLSIRSALSGSTKEKPSVIKTSIPFGYNMTLGVVDDMEVKIYRHHPDPKDWKTKLIIEVDGKASELQVPRSLDGLSLEDPRFFQFNGRPHISYVCSKGDHGVFRSVQAYGRIEKSDSGFKLAGHTIPEFKSNDYSSMQKNWVPVVHDERLWFITGIESGRQACVRVLGSKIDAMESCNAPTWGHGEIRGGTIIEHNGDGLRVFHSRTGIGHKKFMFRYHVGTLTCTLSPPFKPLRVDSVPQYSGDEEYTPGCEHWKPNCILPYGAVRVGEDIFASVGINDCKCGLIKLKH